MLNATSVNKMIHPAPVRVSTIVSGSYQPKITPIQNKMTPVQLQEVPASSVIYCPERRKYVYYELFS